MSNIKTVVSNDQSIYDLTVQLGGSIQEIAKLIPYYNNLDDDLKGQLLSIERGDDPLIGFFEDNNIVIASRGSIAVDVDVDVDADAQAWIDTLTSPTPTEETAINTFVLALKAASLFALLDEYWCFGFGLTNGKFGMKGTEGLFAGGVTSPTSDSAVFSGTTGVFKTNWVPSVDGSQYSLNDAHAAVFVREYNDTFGVKMLFGAIRSDVSGRTNLYNDTATTRTIQINTGSSSQDTGGVIGDDQDVVIERTSSTNVAIHINGVEVFTDTQNSSALEDIEHYVGGRNFNNTLNGATAYEALSYRVGAAVGFDFDAFNTIQRQFFTDLGITI